MVYTAMLNERGGFESDLTVIRLAADRFLIVTGSAQTDARRRLDRAPHRAPASRRCSTDVSAMTAVLSLMGPNARELLGARRAPTTCSRRSADVLATRARSTSASRACAPRA